MKLFVLFAILVAFVSAAPTYELLHPSPVNPDVLVAIKPEEKITLITDPKEIAKFKRETKQAFYPTPLPREHEHHITKRDHKAVHNTPCLVSPQEEIEGNKFNGERKGDHLENHKTLDLQTPQTLPLLITEDILEKEQHKRDIPVPLVAKHHHPEESPKESSETESKAGGEKDKLENKNLEQHKIDISTPKHHHPEESQKADEPEQISKDGEQKIKEISQQQKRESVISSTVNQESHRHKKVTHNQPEVLLSNEKTANNVQHKEHTPLFQSEKPQYDHKPNIHDDHLSSSDIEKSTTQHPLARPHPVPVSELFASRGHGN